MMTSSSDPTRGRPPMPSDVVAWAPDELAISGQAFGAAGDEAMLPARVLDEARREAFDEGYRAGEDAERTRLFHVARALNDGLISVQDGIDRWVANAEENIAALSVAIARHLLSREVAIDADTVMDVVRQAIADFPIDHPVVVRLNPADHTVIVALVASMKGDLATRQETEWVADARIAPGGCVVEGRERIVDGRVDAALERVYRRLTYTGA